jgi:micrococcal nuclease
MPEMPVSLWTYRAKLVRVIDGDTIDLQIDQGFRSYRMERARLLGLNCPEVHGATRAAGDAATAFVIGWLRVGSALDPWPLILQTEKSDVFGRYLATVFRVIDGACLNDDLLASGHAVPYVRDHKEGSHHV